MSDAAEPTRTRAATASGPQSADGGVTLELQRSASPQVLAGRYEILGLLGVGGMGSVYRARDRELEETVALKMLRRELVDMPGMLERFRREVKLARRVTHRNVARVFDIGEHEGEKFLTMELVEGEPLATLLARGKPLEIHRAVELAGEIGAGLASAHAAGVVHRDLKPDNVLLARDGRVVVMDFGIARAPLDPSATQTGGALVGTPAYMAPEQVEGRADVDARADIYAFGALLYELFTSQRAWPGETAFVVAAARLTSPPPDPRQRRPDLPTACAELVLRCMARRPEDRFASMAEVASALSVITLPVLSTPAGAPPVSAPPASAQRITVRPPPVAPPASSSAVETSVSAVSALAEKTVAVLPFRNGGPPEDDYLAEEITDDLIDSLSMTRGLKVRSRGAVMKFKGIDRDPREIGRDLEVQVVAEGSVRRARGNVRVSARLISVADGFQLWAKRFDRAEQDVLSINDEAAAAIAEALTLDREAAAREAPSNPMAVDLYIRARHEYRRFWSGNQERSIELFEQAEALAPGDPMILAGKAMALARRAFFAGEGAGVALAVARQAVAAGPNLAEARLALGSALLQVNDAKGAVRELRQAVARAPGLAEAHLVLGRILGETSALHDAIRYLKNAIALEPEIPLAYGVLCRCHALLGDWASLDATIASHRDSVTLAMRARFLLWRRDVKGAEALIAEVKPDESAMPWLTTLLNIVAKRELPEVMPLPGMLHQIGGATVTLTSSENRRAAFLCQLDAEALCYLGMFDRALARIQQSIDHNLFDVAWLDGCPLFDELRGDPRFAAAREVVAARSREILEAYRAG